MSLFFLRMFTRLTCIGSCERLALSFRPMDDCPARRIYVVPPLLRREVLSCESRTGDYLHGYLLNAGFGTDVCAWHEHHPDTPLHFFWDKADEPDEQCLDKTLTFHRINDVKFLRYMAGCKAYATTAGFESVCEAMYLGKPMLMVPAHIEQDCNAHDAAENGAGIVADTFDLSRLLEFAERYTPNVEFRYWVRSAEHRFLDILERTIHMEEYPLAAAPYALS